ncbi:hypothetical protein D3C80_1542470 [compost metagenome]
MKVPGRRILKGRTFQQYPAAVPQTEQHRPEIGTGGQVSLCTGIPALLQAAYVRLPFHCCTGRPPDLTVIVHNSAGAGQLLPLQFCHLEAFYRTPALSATVKNPVACNRHIA